MEEELGLNNILGAEEIENLFTDNTEDIQEESSPVNEDSSTKATDDNSSTKQEKENEATEVNVDDLFSTEPESVGSEDIKEEKEDTTPKKESASPNNFYSSIAKALKEEGIFPDLDDESYNKIKDPEDFRDLVEQQIQAGLDERQKRIDEALNVGVEPNDIKKYENTIDFLNSIKEEQISDESEQGETFRKNLIYQDFINRGYSKERAEREVNKSLNAGSDIEDAKEALKSNIEFYKAQYKDLIEESKLEVQKQEDLRKEQAEKLKTSIFNDKDLFGDLSLDKSTRQKIYDNLAKPVYKDPDTGMYYTAIQKYEKDNRLDFLKKVSLVFTLTNGFKDLEGLVKGKVRKEVKRGLRELENTLNNTSRTSDGSLKYVSGVSEDPESFISKGWKLDV